MHLRTLALAALALALLAPATASAYTPRHGAPCRHGYTKRFKVVRHGKRRHRIRICVKRKRTAALAPAKTRLHAHLDPSYTRNPLDPFSVTYSYSASATQEPATASAATASSVEEPAPLPSGVLSLYSDGQLECAVNVGSGVEGSECPVHYKTLGEHKVTTIFVSGEQSATETEVENILPLGTATTLSVSYVPLAEPVQLGASNTWHIGDLSIQLDASPASLSAHLGCNEGASEHLTASDCYEVEDPAEHVYALAVGNCADPERGPIYISHATENSKIDGEQLAASALEAGDYHLRASISGGSGYSGSEATAPLRFDPAFEPKPEC